MDNWPQPIDILFMVLGVMSYQLAKYVYRRWRKNFRYKCPKCGFSIKTDSLETFEISVSSHNHSRLQEFKPR